QDGTPPAHGEMVKDVHNPSVMQRMRRWVQNKFELRTAGWTGEIREGAAGTMFDLGDQNRKSGVNKVVGVGGGGGNAVNHMIENNIEGGEFICANTDAQALQSVLSRTVLQLRTSVTKGLGAGANPEVGRQAAEEDRERIIEVLEGA